MAITEQKQLRLEEKFQPTFNVNLDKLGALLTSQVNQCHILPQERISSCIKGIDIANTGLLCKSGFFDIC